MSRSWRVACAVSALTAALFAAGTPAPASAEEIAFKPKAAGDINIRLRGIGVVPTERGGINTAAGAPTGLSATVDNDYVPEIDISYFVTPNIALELIAATTKHDVGTSGPANVDLGSVRLLPPTLTVQYHFTPTARFSPYVGAGLNYTFFYNEKKGALNSISYDDSIGYALQAGIDYAIAGAWSFNIDVKKLWLSTDVTANLGGTALKADVDLNPWIFGVGVGYRF
jgi:outer membrane protein